MTATGSMAHESAQLTRTSAIETVARASALLFENGQTTERILVTARRLGCALGVPVALHPHWGELVVQVEGTLLSEATQTMPLGVDMGKVLGAMTIVDQLCDGVLPLEAARSSLSAVEDRLPSVSALRFAFFAALGAASLGVIFGALDVPSLMFIALSAGLAGLLRRGLATLTRNPLVQPLCAAMVAGAIGAIAPRFDASDAQRLVALCPCMVLVPGPHILNGAIDLVRTRITLGVARLVYAALIMLMICAGLLLGLAADPTPLPISTAAVPVPLAADIVAAGCAVAAFGTFFSLPWRLLPLPIAVGMLAHAARWALLSLAGAHVAAGALAACFLVGMIIAPIVDRLRLPFAALAFSAVVSMMPGVYLFHAASALLALVTIGEHAPVALLSSVVANSTTAFLIILAMTFGLILPRMLFEYFLPAPK
jgi:uncharacterized membrane protein YjjP (DUF1212 family)